MFPGLNRLLHWQPGRDEFLAALRVPPVFRYPLERLPKGIDNAHIDVRLSPQFHIVAQQLVRQMLLHEVGSNLWGEPPPPPSADDVQEFERAYQGMMESAISRARQSSRSDLIQLLQFALLKFLMRLVGEELTLYRKRLSHARSNESDPSSGRAVQLHEQIVTLSRDAPALHYQIVRKLLRQTFKLETTILRKLRKSVLGKSWQVPRDLLFNPLLQLPSLRADEQLMHHYTLAATDPDDPEGFRRVNRAITSLFADYLPAWVLPPGSESTAITEGEGQNEKAGRQDQGELQGFLETELMLAGALQEVEYRDPCWSWLDEPANIDMIIRFRRAASGALGGTNAQWQRFLDGIAQRLRKAGLERRVLAARVAPKVFEELEGKIPVRLICQYLQGDLPRRKLERRLSTIRGAPELAAVAKELDGVVAGIRRMSKTQRRDHLLQFVKEFVTMRRDLKLAYIAYRIMDQLRILTREKDVELSRRNATLHEFLLPEEEGAGRHRLRNHVIIKADVRGSTSITAQLRAQNLNPATHFSLNFFEPISGLLEAFGAHKVFVEGDAVILSIYEYEDLSFEWLAVARACGLARKILQVVDAQNAQNRKHSLPELEIGLGIAFDDEPPTFLYDGDREIMISPAINRADQLSSCSVALRRTVLSDRIKRGVEVVVPVEQEARRKETSDQMMRYNVNGIELDVPAFFKLKSELALRKIGSLPDYSERSVFYAARFPDRKGTMRWLVIREAPVRLWIGNDIDTEEEWGRRYYEVITDPDVLVAIKERFMNRRSGSESRKREDLDSDDSEWPPAAR